jgi:DNA-binding NarL/FixJ family response regulator
MESVRLMIASDNRLYRECLVNMLAETTAISRVGQATSAAETSKQIGQLSPGVVLVDVGMRDALTLARNLRGRNHSTRLVAIGLSQSEAEVVPYVEAQMCGYITREAEIREVLDAISAALRGEVYCSLSLIGILTRRIAALSTQCAAPDAMPRPALAHRLTPREMQIMELVQQSLSNKEISKRLGIEPQTTKNHVHSILCKLGLRRRTEICLQSHLLHADRCMMRAGSDSTTVSAHSA